MVLCPPPRRNTYGRVSHPVISGTVNLEAGLRLCRCELREVQADDCEERDLQTRVVGGREAGSVVHGCVSASHVRVQLHPLVGRLVVVQGLRREVDRALADCLSGESDGLIAEDTNGIRLAVAADVVVAVRDADGGCSLD